ncbi:prolipoprotein diacylglyceryl transferase [Anaerobacillus alkalidiazotrophicus]|uniref:Phosphatidylglycerol--prolipoprotein diacylglyceryl transferase n=1 Tax=Anaerobacillus alkalidiazotrophicus TaxID=472963 RepID=A0A1S2M5J5_9BACI|nr:prolipoprotein diacylglyceryl transferase [Anaerobacillus alkalidiazotrophicus]OIJ18905.1 prolipoprotein diacylglyceryl transferase [Anaerobacillus alkalidiazotrophicus]
MEPLFQIGPIKVYLFGMMIAIGTLVAIFLLLKVAKSRGLNEKVLLDGIIYSFLGGVIGARIVYVFVYNPSYYLANPVDILFLHNGGLSIHGGLLGGLLVGLLFLRKNQFPIWKTLDIVAPFIILAQGISRIGCDVFGVPTSGEPFWAIEVDGLLVHPVQAYEFILNYLLFGYLWLRLKSTAYQGQVFFHYLIGFLTIRGIVEFFRENPLLFGVISVSHVMSLVGILFIVLVMNFQKKRTKVIIPPGIPRYEIVKVWMYICGLTLVSIILYYLLQG